MTFIELSKLGEILKKPVSDMTALDKWSVFLQYASDLRHRETVNKAIESEKVLAVAGELLMSISQNEQERAIFRSRRKFQTDLQSDLATAEDRGRTAEKQDIARSMIADGEPIYKIVKYTGLTKHDIEKL